MLSLLDILFPDATMKLVKQFSPMNFTQPKLTLSEKDFITTLIHELIHVDQNVRGLLDDTERETEAYSLEHTLTNQFLNKC